MSRITNDVETLSQVLSEGTTQILSSVLMGIGVAAIMLWLEPLLAIVAIVSLLLFALVVNGSISPRSNLATVFG